MRIDVNILVAKIFGYENALDLEDFLGIKLVVTRNYNGARGINMTHSDPFYASYSRPSEFSIEVEDQISDEEAAYIKKRVKAKERQGRMLEDIKMRGLDSVTDFLVEHFKVPRHLIETEDIVWEEYSRFKISNSMFNYDGTISDKSFIIYTHSHQTYENSYKMIKDISDFYLKKEKYLGTGLNPVI